jgi:hypothetical protein
VAENCNRICECNLRIIREYHWKVFSAAEIDGADGNTNRHWNGNIEDEAKGSCRMNTEPPEKTRCQREPPFLSHEERVSTGIRTQDLRGDRRRSFHCATLTARFLLTDVAVLWFILPQRRHFSETWLAFETECLLLCVIPDLSSSLRYSWFVFFFALLLFWW